MGQQLAILRAAATVRRAAAGAAGFCLDRRPYRQATCHAALDLRRRLAGCAVWHCAIFRMGPLAAGESLSGGRRYLHDRPAARYLGTRGLLRELSAVCG